VGIANAVDVSNSNIEINQLKSQITRLENALVQSKRSLELLVGRYPEGAIAIKDEFPRLTNPLPETLPFTLLDNRPDILAQHYQLEKAFLEIQEARAARLPSIGISSSFGVAQTNVQEINNLFSNPLVNLGGNLITPLFNGGKLKRNLEIKNIEQRIAIEQYAQTVLNALNEVETSWANLHTYEDQYKYEDEAVKELKTNLSLTEKQIELGTSNTFVLLQKQRQLLKTEVSLINLELNYIIERINLYLALGIQAQEDNQQPE
jgi:outer membrane protein TolC